MHPRPRRGSWPRAAGGSVTRLVGRGPQDVDQVIGEQFVGPSTCTHLNDLLRMLADVPDLATSA
mgnify:CR=1 FL=1